MTDLVLVSYLNTVPFLNGLETEEGTKQFRLLKRMPADCATAFIAGEVDVALLPVGTLPLLPSHKIISNYCIGCDGAVRTVVIMAQCPIAKIKKIYLDMDSRSSSLLAKVIVNKFKGLKIEFVNGMPTFPLGINKNEGVLMIGDKVFEYENSFDYKLDLGQAWKEHTDLPFTFAVWVASDKVDDKTSNNLNKLLAKGIASIDDHHFGIVNGIDLDDYFKNNISYHFNEDKKKALNLFLDLANKYIGEQ